jgi:hypothetical protein
MVAAGRDILLVVAEAGRLRRLKGTLEASLGADPSADLVASYSRIRDELIDALGDEYIAELERLFPGKLASDGQPWGTQSDEVKLRFAQMAGWLAGVLGDVSPSPQIDPQ